MSGELTVPNLADAIRDRVRLSIISAIPDEQVDLLIKKEWDEFFATPQRNGLSLGSSSFQKALRNEIESQMKEKIREAVKTELDAVQSTLWGSAGKDALRQLVREFSTEVIGGLAEKVAVETLQKLMNGRQYL